MRHVKTTLNLRCPPTSASSPNLDSLLHLLLLVCSNLFWNCNVFYLMPFNLENKGGKFWKETSGQQHLIWLEKLSITPLVCGKCQVQRKPKRFLSFIPAFSKRKREIFLKLSGWQMLSGYKWCSMALLEQRRFQDPTANHSELPVLQTPDASFIYFSLHCLDITCSSTDFKTYCRGGFLKKRLHR